MKLRHVVLCLTVLVLNSQLAHADGKATGSATYGGKTLTYELSGKSPVSANGSVNDDVYTLKARLGEQTYNLKADSNQLTWNGKTVKLGDYKKIEVKVNNSKVEIKVDGKVVIPEP